MMSLVTHCVVCHAMVCDNITLAFCLYETPKVGSIQARRKEQKMILMKKLVYRNEM